LTAAAVAIALPEVRVKLNVASGCAIAVAPAITG
jgi:hypothetical protein